MLLLATIGRWLHVWQGHPTIEKFSIQNPRVRWHFCGVSQSWRARGASGKRPLKHLFTFSCAHNSTLLVSSAGWKRSQCLSLIEWGRECILYWQCCSSWMKRFSYSLFNRWNMPCKLFLRVGRHKKGGIVTESRSESVKLLFPLPSSWLLSQYLVFSHGCTKWWAGLSLKIWPLWTRPLSMTWSTWRPASDTVSKSRRLSVVRAVGK
jgi:hypothetical protein